jgi:hypothetical protein
MNMQSNQTTKAAIVAISAIVAFFGLSTFSVAEVYLGSSDNAAQSETADDDMLALLQDLNSAEPLPVVVIREKGAEPHQRIGYDTAFTSQQPNRSRKTFQYMPDASKSLGTESMLSELSKEVAGKVFYELKEEGQKNLNARVAVVAAVPLSDLKRETEFGRIIAEYFLTDLADRGLKVTELRMGSDINILPQTGEFILSRNIGEIANNTPALDYVVVTTFTNTRKTLILQGRLVSLKSGLVKTSWRYNLPLNRELLGLFYSSDQRPFTIAVKGIGQ